MQFTYTAKTTTGELQTGQIEARSREEARQELRSRKLFPMEVRKSTLSPRLFTLKFPRRRTGIRKRDLLAVTTQLAVMTRAGIDLASALRTLSRQSQNSKLRTVLAKVHSDVTGGKVVSESLREHRHVFGEAYIASVAAGEAAGQLPEVLTRLSQIQRAEIRNANTMRALMAYPILLASVSSLVVAGLVLLVLPQFKTIFNDFDIPLPTLTQMLMAITGFLRQRITLWVPALLACIVGLMISRQTESGRRYWDRALLNLVLVREITRAFYIGRTFKLLGLMIDSGVPLLEGLRLTRNSVNNSLYKDLFDQLEEDILNGRGLAASLVNAGFVPGVAAEMVLTAEKTGTLGMVTQLMGEHYEEEGEAKLRELATILEPLIIVVMGAVVATVVMAIMFPMFEIATLAH